MLGPSGRILAGGRGGATQLLPAPWEGSMVLPLESEAAAAGSTHCLAFLLFLTAHQGKA